MEKKRKPGALINQLMRTPEGRKRLGQAFERVLTREIVKKEANKDADEVTEDDDHAEEGSLSHSET